MQSQSADHLLAEFKFIPLACSQMCCRYIPSPVGGLSWLENNAQTLLKTEIGDHVPTGWMKTSTPSLP